MASYPLDEELESASPPILVSIDTLDAFARRLYRRARNAGSNFETASTVVRDLHTVLKHLKVEAEDPESLLNHDDGAVYIRQLMPIIEDAGFTLKQLDAILEKYLDSGSDGLGTGGDGDRRIFVNNSEKGWTMIDSLELDKIDLIHGKLASQKLHIDMFLNTVQLHNPSKSRQPVDDTNTDLDTIKDKVDFIASRLCQRRDSGFGENEDRLWEQFRDALEEEGFSKEVLRNNQDVLRAYVREVDEQITAFGGSTPSVGGFLENYAPPVNSGIAPSYPAYPANPGPAELYEGDIYGPNTNNEKFFPSMKIERLQDGRDQSAPCTMALISTRQLMEFDKEVSDTTVAMGDMHLCSASPSTHGNYLTSSSQPQKCLPLSSSQPALLSPSDRKYAFEEPYEYEHDPPPRYVPSLPPPPLGGERSSPPTLRSNSISAPSLVGEHSALPSPVQSRDLTNQRFTCLGPDSQGREIPLDAKWTRIRRSLVSPEVLARQGLRYEARPDFVAILGELKKEEIVDLARKSKEIRDERRTATSNTYGTPIHARNTRSERERRPGDRYHPDKYRNWDVIEGRHNQNGGQGYVINPHRQYIANSTVGSTGELRDSSDDEAPGDLYEARDRFSAYPNLYPHTFSPRSGSDRGSIFTSGGGDDKGTKAYPFIAPTLVQGVKAGEGRDKTSPSATVKPKPILKNKNDDPHVRFDPEPQILDDYSGSIPRSLGRWDKGQEPSERDYRDRDRDKPRVRDKDRDKRYRPDRHIDRERYLDRNTDRDYEREHRRHNSSSNGKYYTSTSGGRRARDERERDRDRDRGNRKKARKRNTPRGRNRRCCS
ncbi:hypothetical protein NUW58_g6449 [Xylaria curta]|uniref:Uncharacterized protein n=1 Tax=Xylaria curta TaxID=42375 RepID=A0ACC1NUD3_9PEZI|nr:hypothetical protein NUW58_g6449 [Xylaria curta]